MHLRLLSTVISVALATAFTQSASAQSGNVGIGTATPLARLHVADSAVLFTGPGTLPLSPSAPPASGVGTRMMWYPQKAAFRVGNVNGGNWDMDSIGRYSFAAGYNAKATDLYAVSLGYANNAIDQYATSLGLLTTASGSGAISMGNLTTASGSHSTSTGNQTTAGGSSSVSMGFKTNATSFASVAMGRFNDTIAGSNPTSWVATDPLLMIGNGTAVLRSNALTVLKNGNTGIGTSAPTEKLHVIGNILASGTISPSDIRYKKDIELIDHPLEKIDEIRGVTYKMKTDEFPENGFSEQTQTGVIAQEVEAVLPEVVVTHTNGYKAVDYSKIVPLLIEGIKELKKQNEAFKKENADLKKRVERLEKK
jgi:hypothetical protein